MAALLLHTTHCLYDVDRAASTAASSVREPRHRRA